VKDEFELDLYEDDEFLPMNVTEAEVIDASGRPVIMQSLADELINAEVLLPAASKSFRRVAKCQTI
jgi:hypothetical protein